MDHHHLKSRYGIVKQLRLAFLTIALVLATAFLIGYAQMRTVDKSAHVLSDSSVPVFVRTAELERALKNLLLLLQQADGTATLAQLNAISLSVAQQLNDLRTKTSNSFPDGYSEEAQREIAQAILDIGTRADLILTTKRAALEHRSHLNTITDRLWDIRNSARLLLESLSYETSVELEEELALVEHATSAAQLEQKYHQQLSRANAITELTLEVEAIIDIASSLRNVSNLSELKLSEDVLRFKIKGIVVLLGRIEPSETRTDLAQEISVIRKTIFGEDGILRTVENSLNENQAFKTHQSEQIAPIQTISRLSSELTIAARDQIGSAQQNLSSASDRLAMILITTGLASLLTISGALYFLVERQINQRMAKLTEAVLAIANGRTNHDVDVSGMDELGKMARALDVFKLNAEELHRSNTELEKFAYVAAHDLRSPLRAVQDLSSWIIEDTGNVFSANGKEYMGLLRQRVGRLNQLLSDLLEYSRVGKEDSDLSIVSVGQIVFELAEMLDPEGRYNIRYFGPDEPVVTFATPLRHILLNLLNNAIKHHDRHTGQVIVKAETELGRLSCSVQDDGPGIDPQYHDRIFNLFQTLRPRDEVEGSGLGLAIIRKLLEHYGGTILVQSDPSLRRGTLFAFDLPEKSNVQYTLDAAA